MRKDVSLRRQKIQKKQREAKQFIAQEVKAEDITFPLNKIEFNNILKEEFGAINLNQTFLNSKEIDFLVDHYDELKIKNDVILELLQNIVDENKLLRTTLNAKVIKIETHFDLELQKLQSRLNNHQDRLVNKIENLLNYQEDSNAKKKDFIKRENEIFYSEIVKEIRRRDSTSTEIITNEIKDINNNLSDQIKFLIKSELDFIISLLAPKKQELDIERTISYQLGKQLIDSSKSIKTILKLPLGLYSLKKENQKRKKNKNIKKEKINEIFSDNRVSFLTFEQVVLMSAKTEFNGDLIDFIGVSPHKLFNLERINNCLLISSLENILQPRYFYSERKIKINELADIVDNNSIKILSEVIFNGLELDIIVNFYTENNNRQSFKLIKANVKTTLLIPNNVEYITLGVKIYGNGSLNINRVEFLGWSDIQEKKVQVILQKGVSIIIPSYKGEKTILETLNSIKIQKNFNFENLETIIVINGPLDNTESIVKEFANNNPLIYIKLLFSKELGPSAARNFAIEQATKEFLIFLDDDDLISENYISEMYSYSNKDTMVISYINDLDNKGNINQDTSINLQLRLAKKDPNINNCTSAITMIASKMVSTENIKKIKFNSNLKSGEDVCFFSEYMLNFSPKLKIVGNESCAYIRRLRENSVSRQSLSFNFNIEQRLDVIKELEAVAFKFSKKIDNFTLSKMKAQVNFMIIYLKQYPEELSEVINNIIIRKIYNFPYNYFWSKLGKDEPEQLVISYCYPPFVDTSAVIVAKRINQFSKLSDIIANNMEKNRSIDQEVMILNKHYVNNVYYLNSPTSFGGWPAIKDFVEQTIKLTENKIYKQVYSRVLWPASNFAACMYKLRNPTTKWIAEFSDPVILDIEGNKRFSELNDKQWLNIIMAFMSNKTCDALLNENNLYVWCELIAYLFADEIIFTCESQKNLMLSKFPYPNIVKNIENKIKILPHPTPDDIFYNIGDVSYSLDSSIINLGYFGVFYKNRKLTELIDAVRAIKNYNLKYKIHLFTNNIEDVKKELVELKVDDYFVINEYLNYFDFLKVCKMMDVLIVNDTNASNIFGFNPYLPSKISDYLGAGSKIWAFVDSPTNIKNADYFSDLNKDASGMLLSIIREKISNKAEYNNV